MSILLKYTTIHQTETSIISKYKSLHYFIIIWALNNSFPAFIIYWYVKLIPTSSSNLEILSGIAKSSPNTVHPVTAYLTVFEQVSPYTDLTD